MCLKPNTCCVPISELLTTADSLLNNNVTTTTISAGKVCVCVFIPFQWRSLFLLQLSLRDTWVYGSTMLCCGHYTGCFCQFPSSHFLNLLYFTSKDETPANSQTGEKTIWYIKPRKNDIYLIQDISRPTNKNRQVTKRY